jgi:putative endonuclease
MPRTFHVYIMASASRRLYVGMTGNILQRIQQHQAMEVEGFTKRYRMVRLVHIEATEDVRAAIRREKQIKGWVREKKVRLIERLNPEWRDLAEDLLGDLSVRCRRDPSLRSG